MARHGSKMMFSELFNIQAESGMLRNVTNLVVGAPGPDLLEKSRNIMKKAAVTAMDHEKPGEMFQYGPPAGDPVFLTGVSKLLEREYGHERPIENMICTSGATEGLLLIASTLLARDGVVFLEDPTYFIAINMLRDDLCIPTVAVSTDKEGMIDASLRSAIRIEREKRGDIKVPSGKFWALLYLVPTFHNPTGKSMTPERIEKIISIAREEGLLIVCDDVYNLLYYSGLEKPLKRMQDYEKTLGEAYEEGVILSNNTFSKILSPGIRLGWIEGPTSLITRLALSNIVRSAGALNHFTSIVLGHALQSGDQDNMLQLLRPTNSGRMKVACDTLRENLPDGCSFVEPQGGYFIWVEFPKHIRMEEMIDTLKKEHQVVIINGKAFSVNGNFGNCTRISIAYHNEEEIRAAVMAMCNVAKKQLNQ